MTRRLEPLAHGVLVLLRRDAGLSQVRLAERVGVSARQVANYEQGCHSPAPGTLVRLAEALCTSPQALAGVPVGEESLGDLRRFAGLDRVRAVRLLRSRLPEGLAGPTEWKLQAIESGQDVVAWMDPALLKRVIAALAETYGVSPDVVRRSWFRAFPGQAHLLREDIPGAASPKPKSPSRAQQAWRDLNARQRAYLAACFREDQRAEREAEEHRSAGRDPGPASQWRRVPFAVRADPAFTAYTDVQERLRAEGRHDAGAGATLHALARRGLLRVSEDQVEVFPVGFVPRVVVEMTRVGRACARAGLREGAPRRPPGGLLSEWLWRALVKVAEAGADGLAEDDLWGRAKFYLGTGYRPRGVLSRGYIDCVAVEERPTGAGPGRSFRWVVTAAGRSHIAENLQMYEDLYPRKDAGN
jgi:transcriptional regulator with XRE-family HTH domain